LIPRANSSTDISSGVNAIWDKLPDWLTRAVGAVSEIRCKQANGWVNVGGAIPHLQELPLDISAL
jgi:hypothetical protein